MDRHNPDFQVAVANLQVALARFEECLRMRIEADKAAEMGLRVIRHGTPPKPKHRKASLKVGGDFMVINDGSKCNKFEHGQARAVMDDSGQASIICPCCSRKVLVIIEKKPQPFGIAAV